MYYMPKQYDYINSDLEVCDNQLFECKPNTIYAIFNSLTMTHLWAMGDFNVEN